MIFFVMNASAPLTKLTFTGSGAAFVPFLPAGGTITANPWPGPGTAKYMAGNGDTVEITVFAEDANPPATVTVTGGLKASLAPSSAMWSCTLAAASANDPAAPASPTRQAPTAVAPNAKASVDVTTAHAIRAAIVKSAKDELALWVKTKNPGEYPRGANAEGGEAARVELRKKYLKILSSGVDEAVSAQAAHTSNLHWCGIFGIWNVDQGRPTEGQLTNNARWIPDGKSQPSNVIKVDYKPFLHIGDVAHAISAMQKWSAAWQNAKALHKDWTDDQIKADVIQQTGIKTPPTHDVNHHIVIVDPKQSPIPIVQGNSDWAEHPQAPGTPAGTPLKPGEWPYASGSYVTEGTIALSGIDFFYCTVPDKQCMADTDGQTRRTCPMIGKNGKPINVDDDGKPVTTGGKPATCRLPD